MNNQAALATEGFVPGRKGRVSAGVSAMEAARGSACRAWFGVNWSVYNVFHLKISHRD
jgi:hypothetical protein